MSYVKWSKMCSDESRGKAILSDLNHKVIFSPPFGAISENVPKPVLVSSLERDSLSSLLAITETGELSAWAESLVFLTGLNRDKE